MTGSTIAVVLFGLLALSATIRAFLAQRDRERALDAVRFMRWFIQTYHPESLPLLRAQAEQAMEEHDRGIRR